MADSLVVAGLPGIPEVRPGDDLAGMIAEAAERSGLGLRDADILVVTHKVVSKAEGRLVDLATIEPSALASRFGESAGKDPRQIEVVLRESKRIVRMAHFGVLITETHHGFICANAGVDASEVPGDGVVCLLPEDPDRSAEALREALRRRLGVDVAVVITDTFGRPWRNGHVNFAIGVAGMDPFADYRGQTDNHGYQLLVSRIAVADELAAASELVMGKVDQIPVALIRGYRYRSPAVGGLSGRDLIMDPDRDLFR